MNVCLVLGTRPQFIKTAPVHRVLASRGHRVTLIETGQHILPSMTDAFIDELGLPAPDRRLGVGWLDRDAQVSRMAEGVALALDEDRPDWVVVFGDTNSTLAGARAAHARGVPLAHVEAGLRSFDLAMPEEQNRVEADRLSTLLLCPSERARAHLLAEGRTTAVHLVGDVALDALVETLARPVRLEGTLAGPGLDLDADPYLVATVHRVAITDDQVCLRRVFEMLAALPLPVVCPMHPRTTARLAEAGVAPTGAVRAVPPLGHAAMVALVSRAHAVLTDSGGVQKEAYWLGVPCLTLRDRTEWVETVEAGWNHLVGTDAARVHSALVGLSKPATRPPIYGEPGAADRVADLLERGSDRRRFAPPIA